MQNNFFKYMRQNTSVALEWIGEFKNIFENTQNYSHLDQYSDREHNILSSKGSRHSFCSV